LLQGKDFDSIHPSLRRQGILNMNYGLYEVLPGKIYQIRGYDLANISFIKGDTGWIIFDPLTAKETAAAALKFINEQLGERPVVAVVYSHSHADYFGGVRGVVDEADVFEQIGYQKESPSVRNSFLAAAYELRNGIPSGASPKSTGPDMIRAMTTELWLDFLGIRLDSKKAEGQAFKINLVTPDNDEKFIVELSNGTLTNIEGFQADDADLTITINRSDLEQTMMGTVTFDEQIKAGKAKLEGNREPYEQIKTMLVHFELGFEMMPGTGAADLTPEEKLFQAEQPASSAGAG
jgi:alkyl sulfatase BDS1-like metallo-beta-lactamase superfamily hydrolase